MYIVGHDHRNYLSNKKLHLKNQFKFPIKKRRINFTNWSWKLSYTRPSPLSDQVHRVHFFRFWHKPLSVHTRHSCRFECLRCKQPDKLRNGLLFCQQCGHTPIHPVHGRRKAWKWRANSMGLARRRLVPVSTFFVGWTQSWWFVIWFRFLALCCSVDKVSSAHVYLRLQPVSVIFRDDCDAII